jgi:hypothetical protein
MAKLIRACIAMAAFAAIFVIPSAASASPELTHPTGTTVKVGELIEGVNVAHAETPTTTIFTAAGGLEVKCTTAFLTGEVTSNTGTKIAGNITTADFSATPGVTPHTSHCDGGSLGKVTVTTAVPWCVTAEGTKDQFSVWGGKCSEAAKNISFTLHTAIGECVYGKASVGGTYTTHPSDAILTVNKGESFSRTNNNFFCPTSGSIDMAFTLTIDGNTSTPIYIS